MSVHICNRSDCPYKGTTGAMPLFCKVCGPKPQPKPITLTPEQAKAVQALIEFCDPIIPEQWDGESWWCPKCQENVDGSHVEYTEHHDKCGTFLGCLLVNTREAKEFRDTLAKLKSMFPASALAALPPGTMEALGGEE